MNIQFITIPQNIGTTISSESDQRENPLITNKTSLADIASRGNDNLFPRKGIVMEIPKCKCSKLIPHPRKQDNGFNDFKSRPILVKDTLCEDYTFVRGPGQNVVAFTFYEPPVNNKTDTFNVTIDEGGMNSHEQSVRRKYFLGIKENLELIRKFYPGWTMRLYYQVNEYQGDVMKQLCELACNNMELDICDATTNSKLGNAAILYPLIWRFLPVIDRQVDYFLSRDLDSRISEREVACVDEFLKSESLIHVMRDHPAHGASMLGGTWGAKVVNQRKDFFLAFKKLFKDGIAYLSRDKGGGWDQIALLRFVWPWAKHVLFSHDSYTCKKFSGTHPFPTKRETGPGNFIGSAVAINSSTDTECPEKCRPRNHLDWITC